MQNALHCKVFIVSRIDDFLALLVRFCSGEDTASPINFVRKSHRIFHAALRRIDSRFIRPIMACFRRMSSRIWDLIVICKDRLEFKSGQVTHYAAQVDRQADWPSEDRVWLGRAVAAAAGSGVPGVCRQRGIAVLDSNVNVIACPLLSRGI
jgi:hypothetical protein